MSIRYNDKSGGTPQEVLLAGTPATDLILNGTSKNPIANKTVYNALATKIESTVENLVNFYNKSQVYNKQEVRDLIGAINTLTIEVVNELPTQDISATTIYFLKQSGANTYDEYIYVDNAWVKIGDTDIDLSGYLTTANFQIAIADYYTKSAIDAMIANYYTKAQVDAMVDAKQDELTFDNAPTAGSNNPVKSGGIKTALDAKQNTLTFDSTPTASSSNPVTSDGIKDAIDDTAADIYEVMGKNGAKNYARVDNTTTTVQDVTFTPQSDGWVKANGTANNLAVYDIVNTEFLKPWSLKAGTYILTDGLSSSDYENAYTAITLMYTDGTVEYNVADTSINKNEFTITDPSLIKYWYLGICIRAGKTVSNLMFKPMIRLASDTDSTYQPYAMTNQQMTPYVQAISNPNLLDNPWFTINQRGQTTYSSTGNFIAVDRWRFTPTLTVTVNADRTITIVNSQSSGDTWIGEQFSLSEMGLSSGDIVTQSIMLSDGTVYSHTAPIPALNSYNDKMINEKGLSRIRIQLLNSGNYHCVFYISAGANITIKAVKLERGTVSTLAMDAAPNYQQELAKCQRYFVRFKSNATYSVYSDMGYVVSATEVRTPMNLPVSMRQSPTVTTSGSLRIFNATDYSTMSQSITSVSGMGFLGSKLMLKCVGTGFISGKMAMLASDNDADTYIDFSAEL